MAIPWSWVAAFWIAASLLAVVFTVADKRRARRGKWRVSESTLFLLAALGGSGAMLVTMRLIRHKTKHKRFMIGLPVIIVLQSALLLWLARL